MDNYPVSEVEVRWVGCTTGEVSGRCAEWPAVGMGLVGSLAIHNIGIRCSSQCMAPSKILVYTQLLYAPFPNASFG